MAATNGKKLTSTIGYQYFGTGVDGSDKALSVAYLENNISIGIFSTLPPSQQTDKFKFDYSKGHTIYLKGKQAKILSRILKKAVKTLSEGGEIEPTAVSSAGNLIEIANGKTYGMDDGIAIAIYTKINPDKTCDDPAVFQFHNENLIANYNHKNGTYDARSIDSDIDYLIDQLTEFAKGITGAKAHCIKKEMSFDMARFASRQLQCMQALGVNIESAHNSRNAWNSNQQNNAGRGYSTNVSTEDLLSELDSSLA
jgi:hypothetical protein